MFSRSVSIVVLLLLVLGGSSALSPPDRFTPPPDRFTPPSDLDTTAGDPGIGFVAAAAPQVGGPRPNIVLITADDQTDYDLRWMPRTRRLIGKMGVRFSDAISPHPLCCPARAEILTGEFAQNNGVRTNWGPLGGFDALDDYDDTIGPWFQAGGYRTAFVGKFLNGYRSTSRRVPGWHQWHPLLHDKGLYHYYHFWARHNDVVRLHPSTYVTDVLAATTARVVRRLASGRRPFFLWQSHIAPHLACREFLGCELPPVPARRHEQLFRHARLPARSDPAFLEGDVRDKPSWLRDLSSSPRRVRPLRNLFIRRIQSLQAVDAAVARTVRALRRAGVLENTVVVYTSDNGYLLGEHRWSGKDVPYEEALQVPLLVRGPGIPRGERRPQTVATVDLARTFVRLARLEPTRPLDGRDLMAIARSPRAAGWRSVLIQSGPRFGMSDGASWFYRGVRTRRYTYAEYPRYRTELYDRRRDPHQLVNLARRPAYRQIRRELHIRLDELRSCAGPSCRVAFGPLPRPHLPR